MPKVSSYTAVTVVTDSDTFYVIQGGVSSKVTALTMLAYFQSGLGTAAFSSTSDFDAAGTAAAAITSHEGASDPHPQYLMQSEADTLYDAINAASSAITAHVALSDPHTQYLTETDAAATYSTPASVSALINFHSLLSDPHSTAYYTKTYTDANFQPKDATLTALAGVTTASDKLIYATGSDTFSTTTLTSFGRSIIDDVDAAAARTTLGLGSLATLSQLTLATLPSQLNAFAGGRLTTQTGVAIPTADRTSQGTLYYTPFAHNLVCVPDGSGGWSVKQFTELSRSISGLTSGKAYDVVLYLNSGTLTLDLMPAWTNDTTRANALDATLGLYTNTSSFTSVMAGHTVAANAALYVGTIYTTGTAATEDSDVKRYVFNQFNKVPRRLRNAAAGAHTYASTTPRYFNNTSTNKVEFVLGFDQPSMVVGLTAELYNNGYMDVALDGTSGTVLSGYGACFNTGGIANRTGFAFNTYTSPLGKHELTPRQFSATGTTANFNGYDIDSSLWM